MLAAACSDNTSPEAGVAASHIVVRPAALTLATGQTGDLTATPHFRTGTVPQSPIVWSTRNPDVATVTANGRVFAIAEGTTPIVAEWAGLRDSAIIVVQARKATTVVVRLPDTSLTPGAVTQATSTVRDQLGDTLAGRAIAWSSSAPNVASVDTKGRITALAVGRTVISATADNVAGTASLAVAVPSSTGAGPVLVSNAVSLKPGEAPSTVYVSLAPGALADWPSALIRNVRTGWFRPVEILNGGLDPLAVPAIEGDKVSFEIYSYLASPRAPYQVTVPAKSTPRFLRSSIDLERTSASRDGAITLVFSKPIDSQELSRANIALASASGAVSATLTFENAEHTLVGVTPTQPLAPNTTYTLSIGAALRDADGVALARESSVPFTTSSAPSFVAAFAFVRDGEIWMHQPDGTLSQLTYTLDHTNSAPAWSPDGTQLVFARGSYVADGARGIYVIDADGSNEHRLAEGALADAPAWSPDGKSILYSSITDGSYAIMAVDADGKAPARAVVNLPGYDAFPAWSPDSRTITFTSDYRAYDFLNDLYQADADGKNVRPFLLGPFFAPVQFYFQASWSPDGKQIALVACPWGYTTCKEKSAIAVINADGSGYRTIANAGGYAKPTWTRDGRYIIFAASADGVSPPSLRLVRADGSAEGALLSRAGSPAVRP